MPLTDLNRVKSYLQISNTTDDIFIQDLIDGVQEQIENYCNRKFDVATYTENYQCKHKCFPRNTPLISVNSIVKDDNIITTDDYKIRGNWIEFTSDLKGYTMAGSILYANDYFSNVDIIYSAGYATIPKDLVVAATKLTVLEYKESREDRLGIQIEREGDVQYTYAKKDEEMPQNISAVLDNYVQISL